MRDLIFDGICLDPCGIGLVNRNIISKLIDSNTCHIYYNNSFDKYGNRKKMINQEQFKKINPIQYNTISSYAPVILSYPLGWDLFKKHLIPNYENRYKIFHTVTEVDTLNTHCISEMEKADEIWVPSNFDLIKFKKINENSHTIVQGYDPLKYNRNIIPNKMIKNLCKDFVFLFSGTGLYRKGFKEIITAYNQSFTIKDDVTLIIITTENEQEKFLNLIDIKELTNGPHILLLNDYFHEDDIAPIYACADVFCLPSRAEGWALPANEFAGMGKPSIITGYGGQLEFLDKNGSWLIDVDEFSQDPLMFKFYGTKQYENMMFPVFNKKFIDKFSYAMREAHDNKKLTIDKGIYIENKVNKFFTWDNSYNCVKNRLDIIFEKINNEIEKNKKINNLNNFSKYLNVKKKIDDSVDKNTTKSYVIAMLVCNRKERRGENLLKTTIDSIIKSGLLESSINYKLLLHDTGSDDVSYLEEFENIPNIIIKKCKTKSNQVMNGYYMLEYIKENLPCDYIICIEDDILFCNKWLENIDAWIEKYKKEDDSFFTFYCPPYDAYDSLFESGEEIWDSYPIKCFYGAQCFAIPFYEIDKLITEYKYMNHKFEGGMLIDIILQKWLDKKYIKKYIKASIPSFVQHINIGSSLHTPQHTSNAFLGEDIDPGYYKKSNDLMDKKNDKIFTKYVIVINRNNLENDEQLEVLINGLFKNNILESKLDFKILIGDSIIPSHHLNEYREHPNVIIKKSIKKFNLVTNAYNMLSYINKNIECEYVIYIEDDIIFCKKWLENIDAWMDKYYDNTDLLSSFYAPYIEVLHRYENNKEVWDYDINIFYGTKCIIFKKDKISGILSTFIKSDLYPRNNGVEIPGSVDILMNMWLKDNSNKLSIKCSVPNLVQHINISNNFFEADDHKSMCFLGEEIDPRIKI